VRELRTKDYAIDLIPKREAAGDLGISNLVTVGAGVLAGSGGPLMYLFSARQPGLGYTALHLAACLSYLVGAGLLFQSPEKGRES